MSWRKSSDSPVVAKLTDGLGNQIFIFAAALEQARRLGVDVKVETSFYKIHTKRVYGLNQLFQPSIHEATPSEANKSMARRALKHVIRLLKLSHLLFEFKEKSNRFQPEIFKIRPGTIIEGFFQSTKYFPSVGGEIAESIRTVTVSATEQAVIDDVSSRPFIAVHVRRGDYLSESHLREAAGLTTREYYETSMKMIGGRGVPCIVFTDSPQEAKQELGEISELVFDSRILPLGELATLKLMSLASGIVMSNSSFSWWAAYTMSHFDPDTTVISPRPWSKEIYFNEELINRRWWSVGIQN
jgi:hypothetical protein